MKEADIVRSMVSTLNAMEQVYCLRTHGGAFSLRGTPDVLGCARGRFFAIEAKRSAKEKPSPAQQYILGKFQQAGGKVFVSHDPTAAEVVQWVDSIPT